MLEPTTLPTAMPGAPTSAACTLVVSSGVEAPKATSVRPINSGDMPGAAASDAAPRTRKLAAEKEQDQPGGEDQREHPAGFPAALQARREGAAAGPRAGERLCVMMAGGRD